MNRVTTLAAAFCMAASGALAQNATTQAGVEPRTPTGNETYSVRVIGANGVAYNCRPQIQNIAGQATRFCVNSTGATLAQGGLSAAAAGGGLMGAIVLAIVAGDGATTTTTPGATTSDTPLPTELLHPGTAPTSLRPSHVPCVGEPNVICPHEP